MRWRKVAILGVGLLGGSLGMALRRRGLAGEVCGLVRREATAAEAVRLGAVDRGVLEMDLAVEDADLVVLCTPLAQMAALGPRLAERLAPGAVVTDVGSAKEAVVAALEEPVAKAGGRFVGSHPMAGSEQSGVGAAREDLFREAVVVVTPTAASEREAVERVVGLWTALESRVLTMDAAAHDRVVARTSHLPHLLASVLAHWVLDGGQPREQSQLCGTGFRDTTRVASGSPEMWRDIVMSNREAVLEALEAWGGTLGRLRGLIEAGDAAGIHGFLEAAKERRDHWCGAGRKAGGE